MTRTKLKDRILPTYTKGTVAIVLCVVMAATHGNAYGVVSGAIYGTTMLLLYTMSSIYHGLSPRCKRKKSNASP